MSQSTTEQKIKSQQTTPPQASVAGCHKIGSFLVGIFLWFAFNVAMIIGIEVTWLFGPATSYNGYFKVGPMGILFNAANILVNVLGIILVGLKWRWVAFGTLSAFAATLFVITLGGRLRNATE